MNRPWDYLVEADIAKNRALKAIHEILDIALKLSRMSPKSSGMEEWWVDETIDQLVPLIRYFTRLRQSYSHWEKIRAVASRERKEFDANTEELDGIASALETRASDNYAALGENLSQALYQFRIALRVPGVPQA